MNNLLNRRIYRVAWLPAIIALVVVAFSFEDRPIPRTTSLASDAFDRTRSFGPGKNDATSDHQIVPKNSLQELLTAFPSRQPGSTGDRDLAARVTTTFKELGLRISQRESRASTATGRVDLTTVIGIRPGVSPRRIVVVAQRDSRYQGDAPRLSATAGLLELARVFKLRQLNQTLVLISVSGADGGGGFAEANQFLKSSSGIDAVIVLGDLTSSNQDRKPWVIPWSNSNDQASLAFRRTAEAALEYETGTTSSGSTGTLGQWIRNAFPLTISSQGQIAAHHYPVVMFQTSGENGPNPGASTDAERMAQFGRSVVRLITILDETSSKRSAVSGKRSSKAAAAIEKKSNPELTSTPGQRVPGAATVAGFRLDETPLTG